MLLPLICAGLFFWGVCVLGVYCKQAFFHEIPLKYFQAKEIFKIIGSVLPILLGALPLPISALLLQRILSLKLNWDVQCPFEMIYFQ